jgi:transposase
MGMITKKQREKRDRDATIQAYYNSLPTGMRSMRKVAAIFGVSRSTVLYAVNGRPSKPSKK